MDFVDDGFKFGSVTPYYTSKNANVIHRFHMNDKMMALSVKNKSTGDDEIEIQEVGNAINNVVINNY